MLHGHDSHKTQAVQVEMRLTKLEKPPWVQVWVMAERGQDFQPEDKENKTGLQTDGKPILLDQGPMAERPWPEFGSSSEWKLAI